MLPLAVAIYSLIIELKVLMNVMTLVNGYTEVGWITMTYLESETSVNVPVYK